MKRIGIIICIAFIATVASTAGAQTLSVDWKFYGGALVDGTEACFYDAKGLVRVTNGHIKVWTKCLSIKDMEGINIEKDFDGKIVENAGQKVVHHYVPPIASIDTFNTDQIIDIIRYEETADISDIQPHASIFYELNCPERMIRELSIHLQVNGKNGSRDKPDEWQNVPPEGNGARLLAILCPPQ